MMHTKTYANLPGYLFILIGLLLSVVSALVPHFQAGYHLMFSVFVAGMLPYIVYGIIAPQSRGALTTITGLVIVTVHLWLVITQRIIGGAEYSNGLIYIVPIILTVAILPLVFIVAKQSGVFKLR